MTRDSSPAISGLFVGRWWVVLLRGLTAAAFGVLAFAWPHGRISRLALLFGLYALVHGVLSLAGGVSSYGQRWDRILLAFEGIVGIWVGVMTLLTSSATPLVFAFMLWLWAIATGILKIVEAIRLRKKLSGDIWLALGGVLMVLFGLMVILRPVLSVVGLAGVVAAFALLLGLFEILLGCELRAVQHGQVAASWRHF